MKIFILLITFYSSISFGACVPGNIACQNAEIQYFKGQTAPYATPSAGFANLYFDSSVSNGVTPRWQDSLATVYPIIGKITSNRTIYVATTGNDTTGTGLIGAPYLTPQKALDYLSNFMLAPGVEVLISVAAGQYILTSSIVPQHPQGAQITIQGATVASPPTAANFCTPGTIPARGWSNPTAAQRETCANTDLTMLRGKYPTELRFTGAILGFQLNGVDINVANLLLTSTYLPNTAPTGQGLAGFGLNYGQTSMFKNISAVLRTDNISVHGFQAGFFIARGSVDFNNSTVTASNNSSINFYATNGGVIHNNGASVSSNNGGHGFYAGNNSTINNSGASSALSSALSGYVSEYSSSITNGPLTSTNNGGFGVYADTSSGITNNSTVSTNNNNSSGIGVVTSGTVLNQGSVVSNNNSQAGISATISSSVQNGTTVQTNNNGIHGVTATVGSSIQNVGNLTSNTNAGYGEFASSNSTIINNTVVDATGNTSGGIYADYMAWIGITTPGTIQSYNPAINVQGNAFAIIQDI